MANSIIGNVIEFSIFILLLLGISVTWLVKFFRSKLFGGFTCRARSRWNIQTCRCHVSVIKIYGMTIRKTWSHRKDASILTFLAFNFILMA